MGAWNVRVSRQGVQPDLEIFKFPTNAQGFASIVLDATAVAADEDGNRILKAGTLLSKNGTSNQYERFTGAGGQVIRGVLAHTVRFADGTSKSDQPAALAFHGEVFRADRIVDFGTHGAAARAALPTCRFD
jgi:hypothetical protein